MSEDQNQNVAAENKHSARHNNPETFRDAPVSFVRRNGRTTDSQERAWEELSPRFLLDIPHGPATASLAEGVTGDPEELYGRKAPLIVEVGSGQGHAILNAAEHNPETNFLAVEVYTGGLARTMIRAERLDLDNLRLAEVNAPELLERYLPESSVDEVWVFFPDPWPKTKHHKRRLISPEFAAVVHRALKPGGILRTATDWQEYADHMREVMDAAPQFERAFAGEWAERFDGRILTAFEQKGLDKGRDIRDLTYRAV